jgi:hypothetical protein
MRELAELRRVTATASSSGPRSKSQSLPDPVYASIRPSRAYRTLPGPAPPVGPAPEPGTASGSDYSADPQEMKTYTTELSVLSTSTRTLPLGPLKSKISFLLVLDLVCLIPVFFLTC